MRAPKVNSATRRQQIARAALEVICAEGLSRLSIASISSKLKVVPSTVYKHYSGKADVLDAVLDLLQHNIAANVKDICSQTSDPIERLELLLKKHMKMIIGNKAFPQIVFSQCSQRDDVDITPKIRETMNYFIGEISKMIKDGQSKGLVRGEISSEAAAYLFVGMILPAAMLFRLSPDKFDPAHHIEKVWPLYCDSIRVKEA